MSLVYSAAHWLVSLERFSVFAKKIILDVFDCDKWRFSRAKTFARPQKTPALQGAKVHNKQ